MKITKRQLQKIIKEEIKAVTEISDESGYHWKDVDQLIDDIASLPVVVDGEAGQNAARIMDGITAALNGGYELITMERLRQLIRLVNVEIQDVIDDLNDRPREAGTLNGIKGNLLQLLQLESDLDEIQRPKNEKLDDLEALEKAMQKVFRHGATLAVIIDMAKALDQAPDREE